MWVGLLLISQCCQRCDFLQRHVWLEHIVSLCVSLGLVIMSCDTSQTPSSQEAYHNQTLFKYRMTLSVAYLAMPHSMHNHRPEANNNLQAPLSSQVRLCRLRGLMELNHTVCRSCQFRLQPKGKALTCSLAVCFGAVVQRAPCQAPCLWEG